MMKRALILFITFFSAQAVLLFGCPSAEILINEVMADPASDWDGNGEYYYRDDEWIEIINSGDSSVDISGYLLCDDSFPIDWRYGFSGIIGPGEVRVVYGSDSRLWEQSEGFPSYGLSLNNGGDSVFLYRVLGSDTVLVDSVVYENYIADDDRSLGRKCDDPSVWELFDAYNRCEDCEPVSGNNCVPTPGDINNCLTDTEESSWGMVKSIFR
ncbi:MAG: hypothetical protein GF417_14090 [Candidatus Latescibacteria bacterium]|nr:hypothetical protein [bacterium]MBD3425561.1 hypothetical protein [Candidatus Latescibacterota bacterium]